MSKLFRFFSQSFLIAHYIDRVAQEMSRARRAEQDVLRLVRRLETAEQEVIRLTLACDKRAGELCEMTCKYNAWKNIAQELSRKLNEE